MWREIRDKSRRQVVLKSRTVYETRRRQSVRSVDNLHCAAAGSEQEVALEVARRQGLLQKHPTILLRWNFDGSNQIKDFFQFRISNLKSSTRRETTARATEQSRGLCAVQSSPSPFPPRRARPSPRTPLVFASRPLSSARTCWQSTARTLLLQGVLPT